MVQILHACVGEPFLFDSQLTNSSFAVTLSSVDHMDDYMTTRTAMIEVTTLPSSPKEGPAGTQEQMAKLIFQKHMI
jgi:hypothetical protein